MSRKIERKALALFLMTALLFCMVVPATATGSPGFEETIAQVQARYPGAEITIGDDNSIHVVLPYSIDNAISPASADDLYAPEGGTYCGFIPPGGAYFPEIPMFKTYMPTEIARTYHKAVEDPNAVQAVIDFYWDYWTDLDSVVSYACTVLGYNVSTVTILMLATAGTVQALEWVNLTSLEDAMDRGTNDAVSIMITSSHNFPMYIYSGWGGVYVNPDPYSLWNPTWNSEDWIFDL